VTGHLERRLALHGAVRHITHDIFPEPENGQRTIRPALCHRIPCDLFTQSGECPLT
jgi:hypothetical protein